MEEIKKEKDKIKVLRTSRANCMNKIGKEKYDFDSKKEFIKYKYVCCVKLKICEWRLCNKDDALSYSYVDWAEKIREKYRKYNKCQLQEFSRYLKLGTFDNNSSREMKSIVFASLLSSSFAFILDDTSLLELSNAFADMSDKIEFLGTLKRIVLAIMPLFVVGVIVTVAMLVIIRAIYLPIQDENLKKEMYNDYQKIIDELISEKDTNTHFTNN